MHLVESALHLTGNSLECALVYIEANVVHLPCTPYTYAWTCHVL